MIYSAIVKSAGEIEGQWNISPQYTRVDGTPAPDQLALAANGIKPTDGDIVLCVENRNNFDHETFRLFDDNNGACPVIIATFADILTITLKVILGTGSNKMVLGEKLQTWAQSVDAALKIIETAAGSDVVPPITASQWDGSTLSENHRLD